MIGYALCGSYCTHAASLATLTLLRRQGYEVQPILSEHAYSTDTRFGTAASLVSRLEELCARAPIHTIVEAEPLGPKTPLEALVIAPCTGNTLSKIAHGITDTAVCMAAKAHLRTDRPLLIALASNDAMSANLCNIGTLLCKKSVYFVPMHQDDYRNKPHSLVADFSQLPDCLRATLDGKGQRRPLFLE